MTFNDMSSSKQLNVQIISLLSGVSSHGDQHLAEVERDLVQMDGLLGEAIKKLCASFMAIHGELAKQQEIMDRMLKDGMTATDCAGRIETIHGEINRHVSAAVTGLQFQDMTSQLIGRMVKHLGGVREVFGELDTNETALPESSNEALLLLLNDISERVDARCTEQGCGVRSSVNQKHMESGDIDLF